MQDNRSNTIWTGALSGLRFESSLRKDIFQVNVDFRHFRITALESFRYTGRKAYYLSH